MLRKMGAAGTVVAVAGLVATACTNNNGPAENPAENTVAQPDTGASGQVVAAAYDKTTAAKTAKATITTEIGTGGQKVPVNASGVIDFAGPGADLTENMGLGSIEVRFVNGLVYLQLPPQLAQRMGAGKPWSSLDLNRIAQQQYGASLADLQSSLPGDPTDTLGYLRGAGDQVTKVGQEAVNGGPDHALQRDTGPRQGHGEPVAAAETGRAELGTTTRHAHGARTGMDRRPGAATQDDVQRDDGQPAVPAGRAERTGHRRRDRGVVGLRYPGERDRSARGPDH